MKFPQGFEIAEKPGRPGEYYIKRNGRPMKSYPGMLTTGLTLEQATRNVNKMISRIKEPSFKERR